MSNPIEQGRDASISAIRLIAMLMIIICHIMQYYNNDSCRWFNVGVQIFFVISGYLYGGKKIDKPLDFINKGFKKILIPYWLFLILAIILYVFFARDCINLKILVKAFLCSGTLQGLGHLWFVGYILFCYLLTPYLYWIRKSTESESFTYTVYYFLSLIVITQVLAISFDSYFMPDRVACYMIGFFIPTIKYKSSTRQKKLLLGIIFLSALLMNSFRVYFYSVVVTTIPQIAIIALNHYAHMLLGVSLFLILYIIFHNIYHLHYNCILQWSDRQSYSIYIVHLLFILSPFSLMAISNTLIFNLFLVIISSFSLGYILTECSSKLLVKINKK